MLRLSRNCRRTGATAWLIGVGLGCASGPAAGSERVERRLAAMGTGLSVVVDAPTRAAALAASEAAFRAVQAVEARLSTWRNDSELAALNASPLGVPQRVAPELRAELETCWRWHGATAGAFDPCVGALVELWDLRGAGRIPSAEEIAATRVEGGLSRGFALTPGGVVRRQTQARLEEGGFGKGAGLDAALEQLRALNASHAVLDLGGQVALLEGGPSLRWSVADPRDRARAVLSWEFEAGSIATSGNSERARVVEGRRIGHLLDPRSGVPAPDFGSVSVWAARAIDADALSTGLFVLGPREAEAFAAQRTDIAVVVIETTDGGLRAHASPALRGQVAALVSDLQLRFFDEPDLSPSSD